MFHQSKLCKDNKKSVLVNYFQTMKMENYISPVCEKISKYHSTPVIYRLYGGLQGFFSDILF